MRLLLGLAILAVCGPALAGPAERSFAQTTATGPVAERNILKFPDPDLPRIRLAPANVQTWQNAGAGDVDPALTRLHLGPLTLKSRTGFNGRRNSTNYSLDGVSILGSEVSGTVDGRGASVILRWHTDDN